MGFSYDKFDKQAAVSGVAQELYSQLPPLPTKKPCGTVRKPILLLWTDERFLNNPIDNWGNTLITYIESCFKRAVESIVWDTMDSAISDIIEDVPLLENLLA